MVLKKILYIAIASVIATGTFTSAVQANNVGDIIGQVLSTDIVTYIDGVKVPSFNINGRTAVIAENLNALGTGLNFGVYYDDLTRTLSVADTDIYATGGRNYFHFDQAVSDKPIGTPVMNVLYTDIVTKYADTVLPSFNIGGFTCVYADDLAALCGSYIWDESARVVTVNSDRPGIKAHIPPGIEKTASLRVLEADDSVLTKIDTSNRWGESAKSHLIRNDDGTYTVVEIAEHVNIENYDSRFNLTSSFAIKKELPIFGALYAGKDFNYIAFGQENLLEDNSREVIKIVIYDKSFVKISEVSVNNCKTAVPFDASGAHMSEDERYLVLHTSRSQYADESGQRPQTQLTVIVDKSTWQITNILGKFQYNHTSHALRGFVKVDNGRIITANLSDAAPMRGAFLQELNSIGNLLHTQPLFNVGGPAGLNCTGAMVGGLEVSDKGYLVSFNSVDHSLISGYSNVNLIGDTHKHRDVYLLWTDKNTWELKHTCLARYTGTDYTGSVPYLTNLGNGMFMVLWQQFDSSSENSNVVCCAFIDAEGNQVGSTRTLEGQLSYSCQPIVSGNDVVWYVNEGGVRTFYSVKVDPRTLEGAVAEDNAPNDGTLSLPAMEEILPPATLPEEIPTTPPAVTENENKEENTPIPSVEEDTDESDPLPTEDKTDIPLIVDGI